MKKRAIFIIIAIVIVLGLVLLNTNLFWNKVNPIFYGDILNKYAGVYKIDPLLIAAIINVESKFRTHAQSPVGAIGLMQIMPETGREVAKKLKLSNFYDHDLYVPEINIRIGCFYLDEIRKECGADQVAMLASYNAGKNIVKTWKSGSQQLEISQIPYKETRNFISQVQQTYKRLKLVQRIKKLITFRW
ncbi:MAG: lytic transglycosylase domain-containing protein [bacterium]|nr:lytic transglycosylase domain-containing protein [bacterium]MDD5354089.1 lytic transglycosylase domain-containing protein [bacterium]MDD5757095.1 lytic transglycosylase domain-containing protein [bacterium]